MSDHSPDTKTNRSAWPWGLFVGVLSAALVVGGTVGAAGALVNQLVGSFVSEQPSASDQAIQPGDPGSPTAVAPLECEGPCFGSVGVRDFMNDRTMFTDVGLDNRTVEWMTTSPFPVSELYARDLAVWDQWGGQIDDCFVAFTVGPYAPFVGHSDAADDDEIWYLIAHSDWEENSTAYQSLRLFDDTSAATRHMAEVAQSAATCAEQTTSLTRFPGNVSQLAALELPESVAAVGVVAESTPGRGWRVYSWDVQRGNAVARLQIYTDGTTTDQHVRAIAEKYAAELASISPER